MLNGAVMSAHVYFSTVVDELVFSVKSDYEKPYHKDHFELLQSYLFYTEINFLIFYQRIHILYCDTIL